MFERARIFTAVLIILAIGYKGLVELSDTKRATEEVVEDDDLRPKKKRKVARNKDGHNRRPASAGSDSQAYQGPSFQENIRNQELFGQPSDGSESSSDPSTNDVEVPSIVDVAYGPAYGGSRSRSSSGRNPSKFSQSSKSSSGSSTQAGAGGFVGGGGIPFLPKTSTETPKDQTRPVCSASIGAGTFNTSQRVELTCTTASEIKYCLSSTAVCCDPVTEYTSAITVGSEEGTFCLSFEGISETNQKLSDLEELAYIINPKIPNIQVVVPKIFYQTTELSGEVNVASTDFGTGAFTMGVITTMDNDPAVAFPAVNNCQHIVEDYRSLDPLFPMQIMPDTDVATFSNSSQVDVILKLENLIYGSNYVTSYLKNGFFEDALYTCSTSKITLMDYEFFQINPTHGDPGSPSVRQFSGGFTHLGFFEEESAVFRGPAGSSSTTSQLHELKVGMFGMFY